MCSSPILSLKIFKQPYNVQATLGLDSLANPGLTQKLELLTKKYVYLSCISQGKCLLASIRYFKPFYFLFLGANGHRRNFFILKLGTKWRYTFGMYWKRVNIISLEFSVWKNLAQNWLFSFVLSIIRSQKKVNGPFAYLWVFVLLFLPKIAQALMI